MAEILKSHTFTRKAVGARKHDWTTLLDGQVRKLDAGDMGDAKPSTFGSQARVQAAKRGMSVHLQITDDGTGVILQAYPKEQGGDASAETNGAAPAAAATTKKKGKK